MKISPNQYKAAYKVATEVYSGQKSIREGAEWLEAEHELNINSARDYINDFKCMMNGVVFQRAMSAPAIDYFLSQIKADFGREYLIKAMSSVRKHITYYEALKSINLNKLRAVVERLDSLQGFNPDLEQLVNSFEERVSKSLLQSSSDRKTRLSMAPQLPLQITVTTTAFVRNPDVVAEVLIRAAGVCEKCLNRAPFKRKRDDTPYLEVHHIKRLADGGEDTVKNAQALCPNCHRELHYGG